MSLINPNNLPEWEFDALPYQVRQLLRYGHLVGSQANNCLRGERPTDHDWDILIRPRSWREMWEVHRDMIAKGSEDRIMRSSFGGSKLVFKVEGQESLDIDLFTSPLEEYLYTAAELQRTRTYAIDFLRQRIYYGTESVPGAAEEAIEKARVATAVASLHGYFPPPLPGTSP